MSSEKENIKNIIDLLLVDIEEEEVGISLLSTFYQNEEELTLFSNGNKKTVMRILKRLADDSMRHKQIVEEIIDLLSKEYHGK